MYRQGSIMHSCAHALLFQSLLRALCYALREFGIYIVHLYSVIAIVHTVRTYSAYINNL